eukprot:gene28082-37008_t
MCGCNSDTATLLLLPDGFDGRHKFDYDIVIIGRGDVVALTCAKESLRFGAKVAVVEYQDTALIGSWTALREDARHHLMATRAIKDCRPTLSTPFRLQKRMDLVDSQELTCGYRSELAALGVDHLNNAGKIVSPHSLEFFDVSGNKQVVSSARFIMVAGSRPTLLNCPGAENAITLEDLFLKEEAPGKTCIVGSGYAALQCASFLTHCNAA